MNFRKEEIKMNKGKLFTKIIAGIALGVMVFSTVGSLLFYLFTK